MQLSGNTILVTGGSSGIGLGLARRFVELGNTVVVTGRDDERLKDVRRQIPALRTIRCDAADPCALRRLADTVAREHPVLNVLVNNAGIQRHLDLGRGGSKLEELTAEIDVNLSGAIRTVAVLVDRLVRNRGTILNVTSALAFVPLQAVPIYSASKAALHSYTISLRQQLGGSGVEVVELMPPAVATDLARLPRNGRARPMTVDALVEATIRGLRKGRLELRPGEANLLHWMSRIGPRFTAGRLAREAR